MTLEEANKIVTLHMTYNGSGWYWVIDTHTPYKAIVSYKTYDSPEETLLSLEGFLRHFTKDVLKSGDTIRKYVEKHKPKE
jgi:hypothetical protein